MPRPRKKQTNVYREGRIHVMSEMCETCIFRPGNKMQLAPGRVKSMVEAATKDEGCIPCHSTTYGQDERGEAICRGFYDKFATPPIRLAAAMGLIEFQEYVPILRAVDADETDGGSNMALVPVLRRRGKNAT